LNNLSANDEKSLLLRVAEGDENAFRQIFNAHWDNIYSVALAFTKSPVVAEEMVQDIFLRIWLKREKLPEIEKFDDYLFICARNHILNGLRNKLKEQPFTDDLKNYFREASNQPEQQLLLKESEGIINDAVNHLPPQQRKVFILSQKEGLSHEEIAKEMGLSRLTVKTHMHFALKAVRKYMQRNHGGNLDLAIVVVPALLFPL
jgi:RNA polymerase sigma-70 factor (ECF subfamily)